MRRPFARQREEQGRTSPQITVARPEEQRRPSAARAAPEAKCPVQTNMAHRARGLAERQ